MSQLHIKIFLLALTLSFLHLISNLLIDRTTGRTVVSYLAEDKILIAATLLTLLPIPFILGASLRYYLLQGICGCLSILTCLGVADERLLSSPSFFPDSLLGRQSEIGHCSRALLRPSYKRHHLPPISPTFHLPPPQLCRSFMIHLYSPSLCLVALR